MRLAAKYVNTALGRDVLEALAIYRMHVLAASFGQRVAFAEALTNGQTVFDLDPASAASTEAAALTREAMEFAHAKKGGDATASACRSDAG